MINSISFMAYSLGEWLTKPSAIVSMVLMALGLALILSARVIARTVRKAKEVENNDKVYVVVSIIGVIFILAGLVVSFFTSINI